jgi:hypothetical protein
VDWLFLSNKALKNDQHEKDNHTRFILYCCQPAGAGGE